MDDRDRKNTEDKGKLEKIVDATKDLQRTNPKTAAAAYGLIGAATTAASLYTLNKIGIAPNLEEHIIAANSAVLGTIMSIGAYANVKDIDVAEKASTAAQNTWKAAYKRPGISGCIMGAISIPYVLSLRAAGYALNAFPFNQLLDDYQSLYAQLAISPPIFALVSWYLLSKIKNAGGLANVIVNPILAEYYEHRGNHDKAIAIRKKMVRDEPTNLNFRLQLIQQCRTGKAFDEAFEQVWLLPKAINHPNNRKISKRVKRAIMAFAVDYSAAGSAAGKTTPTEEKTRRQNPKEDFNLKAHLANAISAHLRSDLQEARKAWHEILREYPEDPEPHFLCAQALDEMGQKELSERTWNLGISKLLKDTDADLKFEPVGEQRNEVFVVGGKGVIRNLLYFKRKQRDAKRTALDTKMMQQEHETTTYFHNEMPENTAQSLGIFNCKNENYLVIKTAGPLTLDQAIGKMQQDKIQSALIQAARLLSNIHHTGSQAILKGKLDPYLILQYTIYYARRISAECHASLEKDPRVSLPHDSNTIFGTAAYKLSDMLQEIPRHYYKDHSPKNIVIGDLDELICIDFETNKEVACMLDMITLLEMGREYISEEGKEKAVKVYFEERKKTTKESPSKAEMKRWYHLCGIQRHLEILGYRCSYGTRQGQYPISTIQFHLGKALTHAQTFRERYSMEQETSHAKEIIDMISQIKVRT
jgi:tetratricopeptide (TPR) repeat protein